MTDYRYMKTERLENVGIVTFNRPEALNALNEQVAMEVTDALMAFDADDSIGCMILAGGDKAFCAGADLKWIASQDFESACHSDLAAYMDKVADLRKLFHGLFSTRIRKKEWLPLPRSASPDLPGTEKTCRTCAGYRNHCPDKARSESWK